MANRIEEQLNNAGESIYPFEGFSMMPLLRPRRDFVVIDKPHFPLKKYDIPVYRAKLRNNLIMHRILEVNEDGSYTIRGDNCIDKEYNITEDEIIGVVKIIIRNGKQIQLSDIGYRVYTHIWCKCFFLRLFVKAYLKFFNSQYKEYINE